MWNGAGERIWRPLNNPAQTRASAFADTQPRGFGLLQRDRAFDHYQDGVHYEQRPSLWVEPLGDWGDGAVQLIEIPTDDEIHDNVVAFWVPKAPATAGSQLPPAVPPALDRPGAVPVAAGALRGHPHRPRRAAGAAAAGRACTSSWSSSSASRSQQLPFGVKPELVLTAARGKFSYIFAEAVPNGVPGHWRAQFDFTPEGNEPIDMRMYLKNGDQTLTETWLYQYQPG
jgi:glucans biosynthesis protein